MADEIPEPPAGFVLAKGRGPFSTHNGPYYHRIGAGDLVEQAFYALPRHTNGIGIVHGGMLATVVDEAMVWAATWNQRRFCVCGDLSVRFRSPVSVGMRLNVEARVEYSRPKIVAVAATVRTPNGAIVAAGEGKYVPMPPGIRESSEQDGQ